MSDTAARLVDERLPLAPYRQWVFSFPWRIRVALAKDGALLSRVLRVCMNKVFAYQRAKAKAAVFAKPRTLGISFVQRFGSLLQLNPHAHNVVPDGVFVDGEDGELTLWALPAPTDLDVQSVAMRVVKGVLKLFGNAVPDDAHDDEERAADATLVEAAQSPLGWAEPAPVGLPKRRTAQIQTELGMFSVHADTAVAADNRAGLERLLRHASRPAFAPARLSRRPSGKLCYRLRKPYHTGQTEVVFEPVAFLRRLAALVPPRDKTRSGTSVDWPLEPTTITGWSALRRGPPRSRIRTPLLSQPRHRPVARGGLPCSRASSAIELWSAQPARARARSSPPSPPLSPSARFSGTWACPPTCPRSRTHARHRSISCSTPDA